MQPITAHRLLQIANPDGRRSVVEVELSAVPDVVWIDAFGRFAQESRTELLQEAVVYPDTPSVRLTTKEPLSHDNDRAILEWLHDVIASTNDDIANL